MISTSALFSANVKSLAMLGLQRSSRPNKSTVNKQKDDIMNQSSKEIGQPEQVTNGEQKADNQQVSPSIRQCSVSGSVSVVHCKKAKYDVYIGRPSKWGNPFTNRPGTKAEFILPTRAEAIDAYRKWITEGEGKHLLKDLRELKGKTLGCWCKPQSCHGDVLAELVDMYCK